MDLIATQRMPVIAQAVYQARVAARVSGAAGPKPPALLAVRFQDAEGRILSGPGADRVPGLAVSPRFGLFRYLYKPGQEGRRVEHVQLRVPEGAAEVVLSLYRWHAETVELASPLSLGLVPPPGLAPDQVATMSRNLLGIAEREVLPGEIYMVSACFDGPPPPGERAVLAAVQFTTAEGTPLPPPADLAISKAIGPFRYLPAVPDTGARKTGFALAAPDRAARMHVQFLRWECPGEVRLRDHAIGAVTDPAVALAHGTSTVLPGRPHRLTVTLRPGHRRAGPVARVGLRFRDAAGGQVSHPVAETVLFDRPGPGEDWPALCRTGLAFTPPDGAEQLSWWIEGIEDGPATGLAAPVEVAALPGEAPGLVQNLVSDLPEGLCWNGAKGTKGAVPVAGLRRGLAETAPPWSLAARGELDLLAEWAAPAPQGRWLVLSARLEAAARTERQILLCPVFFDAGGAPLAEVRPLGCTRTEQAGYCRPATLRDGRDGAGFSEAFLAPENSATVLVHAFAWPGAPGGAKGSGGGAPLLSGPALLPAGPDEIGEDLALGEMSQLQLRCALQVVQSVGHLQAEARIHAALAAYEARPAGHTVQARLLQDRLRLLDPEFLPDLPAIATAAPSPPPGDAPPLYLARHAGPGGARDAARRAAFLFGAAPVCTPFTDRDPEEAPELAANAPQQPAGRDGLRRLGSVRVPVLSAWPPETLMPTDRARLNARFFADALRDSGAGLVHAVADDDDPGLALAGLALASRHRLPFAYERHGLSEHDWRPPGATQLGNLMSRLRLRQEWRLMQAADVVIVPSLALRAALVAQHLPGARIAVVPQGLEAAFLAPPPPEAGAPRDLLGLDAQTPVLGWTPDPACPEMDDLLAGAAAGLVSEGRALHVICLDAAAPPAVLAALPGRVTATGPLDAAERRAWTAACDLVAVPRPDDQRHGFLPPLAALEAIACHVPLLISDLDCLPEMEEAAPGARLLRIPGPGPAKLEEALRTALDTLPEDAAARTERTAPPPPGLAARHGREAVLDRLAAAHATARANARARIGKG